MMFNFNFNVVDPTCVSRRGWRMRDYVPAAGAQWYLSNFTSNRRAGGDGELFLQGRPYKGMVHFTRAPFPDTILGMARG